METALSSRRWCMALLVAALLTISTVPAFSIDRDGGHTGPDAGITGTLTAWLHGTFLGLAAPFDGLFVAAASETTCEPNQCVDVDGTCCECADDGVSCKDTSGGTDPGGPGGFVDPNG